MMLLTIAETPLQFICLLSFHLCLLQLFEDASYLLGWDLEGVIVQGFLWDKFSSL